jgi:hypothetical protein
MVISISHCEMECTMNNYDIVNLVRDRVHFCMIERIQKLKFEKNVKKTFDIIIILA